jgi:hypothetical protein
LQLPVEEEKLRHMIRRLFLVLLAACASAPSPDAALALAGGYKGPFNNDDQGHADFCVTLREPVVAIRYPDGSPSGFSLTADILVPVASNGVSCPAPGMARLDAREIVVAADGRRMLFHRGGWGFAGNDPESAVHFGHVRVADLDTIGLRFVREDSARRWIPARTEPWTGLGQQRGNGSACGARAATPWTISVHSIPGDMRYLNTRQTVVIPYAIYGNPSGDLGTPADRARGVKYTLLSWSWINTRGGGVARSLIADGTAFYRCTDVPSIRLASVADAERKTRTGWVEAAYGAIRTGDGAWLHGWTVSAHRHGDEAIVRHLVP